MWWGAPKETPQGKEAADAAAPAPGIAPVDLPVNVEEKARTTDAILIEGIRALYEKSTLCDLTFLAGGERFPAHGAIVAAMSSNFGKFLLGLSAPAQEASEDPMQGLLSVASAPSAGTAPPSEGAEPAAASAEQPAGSQAAPAPSGAEGAAPADAAPTGQSSGKRWPRHVELQVSGVESPEAMRLTLSYIYTANGDAPWEYQPSNTDVNKAVLRLARHFGLSHLHEHAARWLTKGLNTTNVVDRLVTCEEFGLNRLRERIIEQLTAHPAELAVVSSSAEIMRHPRILQDLLVQVASLCGVGPKVDSAEKADKADKVDKADKTDKTHKKLGGQGQAPEKPEKPEKAERAERAEKTAAPEKPSAEKPAAKRAKRGAAGA